jgi:hypothetical protein
LCGAEFPRGVCCWYGVACGGLLPEALNSTALLVLDRDLYFAEVIDFRVLPLKDWGPAFGLVAGAAASTAILGTDPRGARVGLALGGASAALCGAVLWAFQDLTSAGFDPIIYRFAHRALATIGPGLVVACCASVCLGVKRRRTGFEVAPSRTTG